MQTLGRCCYPWVKLQKISNMPVHYRLKKNEIRSSSSYGKYFAYAVKQGEVGMDELSRIIERNCTATRGDVLVVLTTLVDVVKERLQEGYVVDLGELGRLSLGLESEGVWRPEDFSARTHIKRVHCNYSPDSHRRGNGDRRIVQPITEGCKVEKEP